MIYNKFLSRISLTFRTLSIGTIADATNGTYFFPYNIFTITVKLIRHLFM